MNNTVQSWINKLRIPNRPDEQEVKSLLEQIGITVPENVLLEPNSPLDLGSVKSPFAVKICNPNIIHKTDTGGIRLNLSSEKLPGCVTDLRKQFPGSSLLVEQMVPFAGPEFIIGALSDPVFGPSLMVGAGGILTELYKDVSFRLAPCSRNQAKDMLNELTVSEVFNGFRGSDMDMDSLADIISKIGDLVVDLGDRFSQLDINPIVYSNGHWVALDGVIVLNTT